jgi:hypothetical protein
MLSQSHLLHAAALTILAVCTATAIPVLSFQTTDFVVQKAQDIVVAECVYFPTNLVPNGAWLFKDGLCKARVNVLRTLKGNKPLGDTIIATLYPMTIGKRYLLWSLGNSFIGEAGGVPATDFFAVDELSSVEFSPVLNLGELDHKDLKEQIQLIYSVHLAELESKISRLNVEKSLLEKAVSDRAHDFYDSKAPVKIGPISEQLASPDSHGILSLNLQGNRLEWSGSLHKGYLYSYWTREPRSISWEFAPTTAKRLEDLAGTPLKSKFYGPFTPGRIAVGWEDSGAITVHSGDVILARVSDEPQTVFAIQIVHQSDEKEEMTARCALLK